MSYDDVKNARINAKLTQKAMSEQFNIPLRTVSDWERGLRTPPEWVCMLLVNALTQLSGD